MPRDPRTFITLHDGMPEHHKIEALSDKAFRTLIDLWCWCSRNTTDGDVPESVWLKRTTARVRGELLQRMVEPRPDGVYMHDYLEQGVRVDRISAVVDCGRLINPELARQQIEGGIIFGLAQAVGSATEYENGLPVARRLRDQVLV